jgi:ATP-dependent RNA helicase DeaD
VVDKKNTKPFKAIIEFFCVEKEWDMAPVAGALLYLAQHERPFRVPNLSIEEGPRPERPSTSNRKARVADGKNLAHGGRPSDERRIDSKQKKSGDRPTQERKADPKARAEGKFKEASPTENGPGDAQPKRKKKSLKGTSFQRAMSVYRVEVGSAHGLEPRNLVGAIANEAGLDSKSIGSIRIAEEHTVVELPSGMPKEILTHLKKVWVCERQLAMKLIGDSKNPAPGKGSRTAPKKKKMRVRPKQK